MVYGIPVPRNMDPLELLVQAIIPSEDLSDVDRETTPLHVAARNGDLEEVKRLVTLKAEGFERQDFIDKKDDHSFCGMTAIGRAVVAGHPDIVEYLIKENANLGERDELLRLSVENNKAAGGKLVKLILDAIPEVDRADCINTGDFGNNTPVHLAALHGVLEALVQLVNAGGKLSTATDEMGDTPLIMAIAEGNEAVVKYILDNFDEAKEGMSKINYIKWRNFEEESALDLVNDNLRILLQSHMEESADGQ